jgi:hypothetical protein
VAAAEEKEEDEEERVFTRDDEGVEPAEETGAEQEGVGIGSEEEKEEKSVLKHLRKAEELECDEDADATVAEYERRLAGMSGMASDKDCDALLLAIKRGDEGGGKWGTGEMEEEEEEEEEEDGTRRSNTAARPQRQTASQHAGSVWRDRLLAVQRGAASRKLLAGCCARWRARLQVHIFSFHHGRVVGDGCCYIYSVYNRLLFGSRP